MINQNELYLNTSIKKILSDSLTLFRKTGLDELAQKWEKILKNYIKKKSVTIEDFK